MADIIDFFNYKNDKKGNEEKIVNYTTNDYDKMFEKFSLYHDYLLNLGDTKEYGSFACDRLRFLRFEVFFAYIQLLERLKFEVGCEIKSVDDVFNDAMSDFNRIVKNVPDIKSLKKELIEEMNKF